MLLLTNWHLNTFTSPGIYPDQNKITNCPACRPNDLLWLFITPSYVFILNQETCPLCVCSLNAVCHVHCLYQAYILHCLLAHLCSLVITPGQPGPWQLPTVWGLKRMLITLPSMSLIMSIETSTVRKTIQFTRWPWKSFHVIHAESRLVCCSCYQPLVCLDHHGSKSVLSDTDCSTV